MPIAPLGTTSRLPLSTARSVRSSGNRTPLSGNCRRSGDLTETASRRCTSRYPTRSRKRDRVRPISVRQSQRISRRAFGLTEERIERWLAAILVSCRLFRPHDRPIGDLDECERHLPQPNGIAAPKCCLRMAAPTSRSSSPRSSSVGVPLMDRTQRSAGSRQS
jgi:hypothetical protein